MDLSVVIPAYNELERLPRTLERVVEYLKPRFCSWEIIVSDDGSIDGMVKHLRESLPGVRFLRAPYNRGKGAAVRCGMIEAQGDLRLFSDADLSTPIEDLGRLRDAIVRDGHDVAIASRGLPDSVLEVRQPLWRELSGRTFNKLVRPLAGLPFHDTQCGFKLFKGEAARNIFGRARSNGWAFDVEALMLASMLGYSVAEVPVHWINDESSKVRMAVDAPCMALDILRFRWWMYTGRYGAPTPVPAAEA